MGYCTALKIELAWRKKQNAVDETSQKKLILLLSSLHSFEKLNNDAFSWLGLWWIMKLTQECWMQDWRNYPGWDSSPLQDTIHAHICTHIYTWGKSFFLSFCEVGVNLQNLEECQTDPTLVVHVVYQDENRLFSATTVVYCVCVCVLLY